MTIAELLDQIRFARSYTTRLLDHTPQEEWFEIPLGGVSHVGWQVGHLIVAGYNLTLKRARGRLPGDEKLVSDEMLARFGRESVADPDMGDRFSAAILRATYDRVHDRIQAELPGIPAAQWELPLDPPHMICKTRLECLAWCGQHEMVHAGQIGLLRRLLGHAPVW